MTAVVHPVVAPRRGAARAGAWWGRAWVRAVEEVAYDERTLASGRALARSGRVGAITTGAGRFAAEVEDGAGACRVTGELPVLDEWGLASLVEAVAAGSGRAAALLAGDLPHDLVEHAEEAGVELLPYGGELATSCTCRGWHHPCEHALAVLSQLTWLVEADPFVLLHLRGLPREQLLSRLHAAAPSDVAAGVAPEVAAGDQDQGHGVEPGEDPPETLGEDLDVALDAALRAAAVLRALGEDDDRVERLL